MDQLEKYIRENQEALDRIEPVDADALWERLQKPQTKLRAIRPERRSGGWQLQIGRNWILTAAATVLLLVGVSVWTFVQDDPASSREMAAVRIQDYYPELADEETAFRRTIARKEAELGISELDRQQFVDIFHELDELEKIHREQLQDLPEVFDNEEWVRTLMQYYEQKLRILEHLSREIDKQEQLEEREQARSI